jgi:hypothetical protein
MDVKRKVSQAFSNNNNNNDRKTRKTLTMRKILHPKADIDRLYVKRKEGGRGLVQIEAALKQK